MEGLTTSAAALSTYGLYFIVCVLAFVAYKLFVKMNTLEKEFRDYMQRETEEAKKAHDELLGNSAAALNASTQALNDSTETLKKIAILMERLK